MKNMLYYIYIMGNGNGWSEIRLKRPSHYLFSGTAQINLNY